MIYVYALRDWSFKNIEPALEGLEYTRIYEYIPINQADLIITCEPHGEDWCKIWAEVKGKIPVLAMQQGISKLQWEHKKGSMRFDKIMVWGERGKKNFIETEIPEDRIVVTGCPRYDKYFKYNTSNTGSVVILGGGGEVRHDYRPIMDKYYKDHNIIFIPHPNVNDYKIYNYTDFHISEAHRVVVSSASPVLMAMCMSKEIELFNPCPRVFGDYDNTWFKRTIKYKDGTRRVREEIERCLC